MGRAHARERAEAEARELTHLTSQYHSSAFFPPRRLWTATGTECLLIVSGTKDASAFWNQGPAVMDASAFWNQGSSLLARGAAK